MKISFLVLVILFLSFSLTNAQVSKDGWAVGFGLVSPRLFSDVDAENFDFGGQLVVQKNLSEQTGLRLSLDYLGFTAKPSKFTNNTIKFGISAVYNLFPCAEISPFIGVGGSVLYYTLKNAVNVKDKSYFGELTTDIFFGGLVNIDEDLFAKVEFGGHTISTDKFDGTVASGGGGLFGGSLDSYTSINLGLLYYFDPGTRSTNCDKVAGMSDKVDYVKIEDIVRKYTSNPTNIDYAKIEDIVKKNCGTTKERIVTSANWVLIGVNFEFAKAFLTPESFPILVNALQILLCNPEIRVEIQGHTDIIGSESFNKKLSEQRAETVKRFLVAKGVSSSRLSTVGFGSTNPAADNNTAEGRSLNRRIEFKVLGK